MTRRDCMARDTQVTALTQAARQLTFQSAARLDIEGPIDCLVTDPHRRIIGKLDRQAMSNLLSIQRDDPSAILETQLGRPVECWLRRPHHTALSVQNHTVETILHVDAKFASTVSRP